MSAADDGRSLGQLIASATSELPKLVHDEVALAKLELRDDLKRAVSGSTTALVAAVFALFALPMFSFGAAYGLHHLGIPLGWAFTIVGGVYVLLALLLLLTVRAKFRRLSPPTESMASFRETAAVLSSVKPHPRGAHADNRELTGARQDGQPVESVTRSQV